MTTPEPTPATFAPLNSIDTTLGVTRLAMSATEPDRAFLARLDLGERDAAVGQRVADPAEQPADQRRRPRRPAARPPCSSTRAIGFTRRPNSSSGTLSCGPGSGSALGSGVGLLGDGGRADDGRRARVAPRVARRLALPEDGLDLGLAVQVDRRALQAGPGVAVRPAERRGQRFRRRRRELDEPLPLRLGRVGGERARPRPAAGRTRPAWPGSTAGRFSGRGASLRCAPSSTPDLGVPLPCSGSLIAPRTSSHHGCRGAIVPGDR